MPPASLSSNPTRAPGPRWRGIVAVLVGALTILLGLGWIVFREPRFNGRTAEAWLDAMGPVDSLTLRPTFAKSAVRQEIRAIGSPILPALEREFKKATRDLEQSRSWHMRKVGLWVQIGRLLPGRLSVHFPAREIEREKQAEDRMIWSACLLMDLSSDLVSGLARFESAWAAVTPPQNRQATTAFSALHDGNGALTAALVQRLQSPSADATHRALWLSCLGQLGPQAVFAADFVRSLTRDPNSEVRVEAIKALGGLDTRDDTAEFIRGCGRDVAGRQAAMVAFLHMGERARPARDFIEAAVNDPDMLTSFFAKNALRTLGARTNGLGME